MIPTVGKKVHVHTYVHISCLELLEPEQRTCALAAAQQSGLQPGEHFNVLRFESDLKRIALLSYPEFFEAPYPELKQSWVVDLEKGEVSHRTYQNSFNPPILHRKELLLPKNHPRASEFASLTAAAESIGLFDDTTRIGFREQWNQLIRDKGYRIVAHQLIPIGNDESIEEAPPVLAPVEF